MKDPTIRFIKTSLKKLLGREDTSPDDSPRSAPPRAARPARDRRSSGGRAEDTRSDARTADPTGDSGGATRKRRRRRRRRGARTGDAEAATEAGGRPDGPARAEQREDDADPRPHETAREGRDSAERPAAGARAGDPAEPSASGDPGPESSREGPDGRREPDAARETPQGAPEPVPLEDITMSDLDPRVRAAAQSMGWSELMPVQSRAIPYLRNRRDVMVQSRTGSGKTGAFIIPMLEEIDTSVKACQALVLVPTRELARQVGEEAEKLGSGLDVTTLAVYGGVAYGPQLAMLERGAHIVVGTPGRILDHLMRGRLELAQLRVFVMDEADRMLSMGFYPDMVAIRRYLPVRRSSHMFSATYPGRVKNLAHQFLSDPEFVSLSHGHEHVAETEHVYYEVPKMEKHKILVDLIEIEDPESAIIFTNTRDAVNFVSVVLQRCGIDADQLSANLTQSARENVLSRVYNKELRVLVATDVAARGIDISNLSHVFLYDFPEDPESYIHRTGRTGRAGASGTAISLVDVLELMRLKEVERQFNVTITRRELPRPEDVERAVGTRATRALAAELRETDKLGRDRLPRMIPIARRLLEDDEDALLLAMLLDRHYQGVVNPSASKDRASGAGSGSASSDRSREDRRSSRGSGSARSAGARRSGRSGGSSRSGRRRG